MIIHMMFADKIMLVKTQTYIGTIFNPQLISFFVTIVRGLLNFSQSTSRVNKNKIVDF